MFQKILDLLDKERKISAPSVQIGMVYLPGPQKVLQLAFPELTPKKLLINCFRNNQEELPLSKSSLSNYYTPDIGISPKLTKRLFTAINDQYPQTDGLLLQQFKKYGNKIEVVNTGHLWDSILFNPISKEFPYTASFIKQRVEVNNQALALRREKLDEGEDRKSASIPYYEYIIPSTILTKDEQQQIKEILFKNIKQSISKADKANLSRLYVDFYFQLLASIDIDILHFFESMAGVHKHPLPTNGVLYEILNKGEPHRAFSGYLNYLKKRKGLTSDYQLCQFIPIKRTCPDEYLSSTLIDIQKQTLKDWKTNKTAASLGKLEMFVEKLFGAPSVEIALYGILAQAIARLHHEIRSLTGANKGYVDKLLSAEQYQNYFARQKERAAIEATQD